jgi:hypothetical protein
MRDVVNMWVSGDQGELGMSRFAVDALLDSTLACTPAEPPIQTSRSCGLSKSVDEAARAVMN